MEKEEKELIRRKYVDLAKLLKSEIELIIKTLYSSGIISEDMADRIMEENKSNLNRAYAFLDLIPKRGQRAFPAFYDAVLSAEIYDAADILRPENAPHEPSPSSTLNSTGGQRGFLESDDEEPPDVWPHVDPSPSHKPEVKKVADFEGLKREFYVDKYHKSLQSDNYYTMKNRKRGKVIVINNERFETLDDRGGTDFDKQALYKLFDKMGFEVNKNSVNNKTSEEMEKFLREKADGDFSKDDCVIVILLSHGHNGVVFGTDGKMENGQPVGCVAIKWMTDLFCGVTQLHGKPKLFFVQACQGGQKDSGIPSHGGGNRGDRGDGRGRPADDPTLSSTTNRVGIGITVKQDKPRGTTDSQLGGGDAAAASQASGASSQDTTTSGNHGDDIAINPEPPLHYLTEEGSDAIGETKASTADVFVGMATPPDFLSWRRPDFGTWFIQAVVEVFSKYAYKKHLKDMMTKVNQLMEKAATKKTSKQKGSFKQTGYYSDTLSRDLYFFPGLPVDNSQNNS